jgi:hypothetical protein
MVIFIKIHNHSLDMFKLHYLIFIFIVPGLHRSFANGQDAPHPQVPAHWIHIGNEMEDTVADATGRPLRYITAGNEVETHFHYHNTSWGWIQGQEYLFIESCRQRPPAAGTGRPGERQILAANAGTGDMYYITTIPNDNPANSSQWESRQYRCDYFKPWNELLFLDKSLRKIWAHNCISGKQKVIFELPPKTTSRQFAAAELKNGGIRFAYSYSEPVPGGRQIMDIIAYSDFDRDFNPVETKIVRRSKPGEAYDHVNMRPGDPDCIFYYHHFGGIQERGGFAFDMIRVLNLTDPDNTEFTLNPDNSTADHHTWSASGRYIHWDDNRGTMFRYDVDKRTVEVIGKSGCIHNRTSPDETLWAYDIRAQMPYEKFKADNGVTIENWWGEMFIYDIPNKRHVKLADIVWASPHPRHPHVHFSPDGTRISFVVGVDKSINTRIAIMRVP